MKVLICLFAIICIFQFFTYSKAHAQTTQASGISSNLPSINGLWKRIYLFRRGKGTYTSEPSAVHSFDDGVYSIFATDSAGKWNGGSVGTYEIIGNTMSRHILYSNNKTQVGSTVYATIEFKGDTLFITNHKVTTPTGGEFIPPTGHSAAKLLRFKK